MAISNSENNNVNDVSTLKYTSRDYASIFEDLTNTIPLLTSKWTGRDETDPGIVLVKLMAMLGDMLSYNQDKKALEVYPESVTERKNAQQIFELVGYNMHWYRSAQCVITLSNSYSSPVTIPKYTRFYTSDERLCYTNLEQIEIPGGNSGIADQYQLVAIQGTPRTPLRSSKYTVPDYNKPWHSIYNYNMYSRDITNNKYYLQDTNIDETSITLVDSSGEEWTLVDSVDLQIEAGKFFEFRIDEYDRPYIRLISYWQKYDVSEFKIFYVLSDGSNGTISANMLTKIDSSVYAIDTITNTNKDASSYLSISNYRSEGGYDPETPDEARSESKNYINTLDTLVTLADFEHATNRIDGVAKCLALDCTNDPDTATEDFTVNIYVDREDEYANDDPDSFGEMVKTSLHNYRMMPLEVNVYLDEKINRYYWTVKGDLYLTQPVDIDTAKALLVNINNMLKYAYGPSKVNFNQDIRYIDVINTIMSVDKLINYVDLEQIEYIDSEGNPADKSLITGKYTQTFPFVDNQLTYDIKVDNYPVRPGSVIIKINNGNYVIMDNGSGGLIDSQGLLGDRSAKIDYTTGEIHFTMNFDTSQDIIVSYSKNIITTVSYVNLDAGSFNVVRDSIIDE